MIINGHIIARWNHQDYAHRMVSLAPIDGKSFAFYGLEIFANNFLSIGARDMKHCHSTRIVMAIPTSRISSFYDHWMARYRGLTCLNYRILLAGCSW